MKKTIKLILAVCLLSGTLTYGQNVNYGVVIDPPPGVISSSWLGNSLPGSNGQWVQNFIAKIQVQPDGTVYAYSLWDEAGQRQGKYKDGQNTGQWNGTFDISSVTDKNGNTWRIENLMFAGGTDVVRDGSDVKLPDAGKPISLSLANDGKIMVADNGPDQQVKFYDVSDPDHPVLSSTFGVKGGYLANTPKGKLDSLHFAGLRGAGMDSAGNIYVAGMHPGAGSGSWISAHKPDGTLLWRLMGECFLQVAAVDPATDGADIYSGALHYKMDYTKPAGKEQGDFPYSVTTDLFANATTDDRLAIYDNNTIKDPTTASWDGHYDNRPPGIVRILNLFGNKYIFGTSQNGPGLSYIKFVGQEQAIDSMQLPDLNDDAWGCDVDDKGGIWIAHEYGPTGIWYYPCTGKKANGDLTWGPRQSWAYPSDMNIQFGCRIYYDEANDNLYISATTNDLPRLWGWGTAGSKIFRYDGWLYGSKTPHAGFPIILPQTAADGASSNPDNSIHAKGIAWAGDYIFVVYSGLGPKNTTGKASEVSVFDANTGASVGTLDVDGILQPHNSVNFGWTDITNPVTAYKRANGEYIVIMEEDCKNKNLLWRWNPTGAFSSCDTVKVTGFQLDKNTDTLNGSETKQLSAEILPNTACRNITWESIDPTIVRVMGSGSIIGLKPGTTKVVASIENGSLSDTCTVTVNDMPVTGVVLDQDSLTVIYSKTEVLHADVIPENALNKTVTWSSLSPEIASVDENGHVTGISTGETGIVVTTANSGFTDTCWVSVQTIPVSGVVFEKDSITVNIGRTIKVNVTVLPEDASIKTVTYSILPDTIASIDASGRLKGLALGNATIIVSTVDGNKTDTAQIIVDNAVATKYPKLISLNFDDGTGNVAKNTGTLPATFKLTSNIPTWSTNVPAVGGSNSVDFGVTAGEYVVESDSVINGLKSLSAFTITGWVNCRSSEEGGGGNRIVSWINDGGDGVDLVYHNDGSIQMGINQWSDNGNPPRSSAGKITTDSTAGADNWVFFAVTYDASIQEVSYYFGNNKTTATLDTTLTYDRKEVGTDISKLAIGHFNIATRGKAADRMFRGLMDEVDIYGGALTPEQIIEVQKGITSHEFVESFDYPTGDINGQGTANFGWGGPWVENSGELDVVDGNLGTDVIGKTGTTLTGDMTEYFRDLYKKWEDDSSPIWISFYFKRNPSNTDLAWGGLSLMNSGNEDLFIGSPYPAGTVGFGSMATTISDTVLNYVTVKLEMDGTTAADSAYMWVNYFGSSEPVKAMADANASWGTDGFDQIRIASDGNYSVSFDKIRIADSFKPNTITTTGIKEHLSNKVFLYPNPAKEMFYLSEYADKIIVTDIQGREVLTTKGSSVDISSLKHGIYIVEYFVGQTIGISKVIKQ